MTSRALLACIVLVAAAACDDAPRAESHGAPTGSTCPPDNTLTYQSFGQDFMTAYCTRCHASTLSGPDRLDAPVGYDFDTLGGVRQHLAHIDVHAAAGPLTVNDGMPETDPRPSVEERRMLGQWIACGAP